MAFVRSLCLRSLRVASSLTLVLGCAVSSHAQAAPATTGAWAELSPLQRSVLRPLQNDWETLDSQRRHKWVEVANRFPTLPKAEQERIQARMVAWTRLSPSERGQTRQNFKDAQQAEPQDRRQRWEAYKALPPDRRQELANRGAAHAKKPRYGNGDEAESTKSSLANPGYAARQKNVAPTLSQAQPGATTTLISKRPAPPAHQQAGQPKIAGTPEFVDKTTLLPKRGPQGAAVRGEKTPDNARP